MTSDVKITRHARDRMRERLGLPKKAVQRAADKAFSEGYKHRDFKGSMLYYLNSVFLANTEANGLRVYGEYLYVFCDRRLVTVFCLPCKFRRSYRQFLKGSDSE